MVCRFRFGLVMALVSLASAAHADDGDGPSVTAIRRGVKISGYLQADLIAWTDASKDEIDAAGEPINDERFLIRRGRVRAEYEGEHAYLMTELDANTIKGPLVRVTDAEAGLRLIGAKSKRAPWAAVDDPPRLIGTIGLFKIPFGFEVPQADTVRVFLERSNVMDAFFPGNRDLGARIQGAFGPLRAVGAVMNGQPISDRAFPGRDPNAGKDFIARVGIDQRIASATFTAGVSGLAGHGFHKGAAATMDTLKWTDTNMDDIAQPDEIVGVPGMEATPSKSFYRWAAGGDLLVRGPIRGLGELTVYGELVLAHNLDRSARAIDPIGAKHTLKQFGWYAAATQEIASRAVIGVRYDRYDPDRDGDAAKPVSTLAATAGWLWKPDWRLVTEFDHTRGATKNDAITARVQVVF
jgi:hypothetical protein